MRANIAPITVLALTLAPLGCAEEDSGDSNTYEPSVDVQFDKTVDFSIYSTFDIIDPTAEMPDAPPEFLDFQTKIDNAVTEQLEDKGLERTLNGPDLLINPFISVESGSQELGWYGSQWGAYYGYEALLVVPVDYEVGTLSLDVIAAGGTDDRADDFLIFRGTAYSLLAQDPPVIDLNLRNAIKLIFDEWPAG